jgi:phosphonate transport system substrate-binding protein
VVYSALNPAELKRSFFLWTVMMLKSIFYASRYRHAAFSTWKNRNSTVLVGAVAYSDSTTSIWEGMKKYFVLSGVDLDFVLFTSYERQLEALLSGHIDIAWNGPIAHVRLQKIVDDSISLGMRDVDRDFQSYIVSTKEAKVKNLKDIEHKRLATGSLDSPQAFILPMHYLKEIDLSTIDVICFDKDVGKHGDTAVGEMDVIECLRTGQADVGFVSKLMFDRRDHLNIGDEKLDLINIQHVPVFDHCQFDSLSSLSMMKRIAFQEALFRMDFSKKEDRKVMISEVYIYLIHFDIHECLLIDLYDINMIYM